MKPETPPQKQGFCRSTFEITQDDLEKRRGYFRLRVGDEIEDELVKWTKNQRSRSSSSEQKNDVVLLQSKLRNEEWKDCENVEQDQKKWAPQVSSAIIHLLGRKEELVKRAWARYVAESKMPVTFTPGNITAHKTNISDSRILTREL